MKAPEEPFDVDALISLERGVRREALEAFFKAIADSGDTEKWNEVVRFAYRAGWRVLPEILADDSPDFFKPIKRYVFAASCRALFAATHPDAVAAADDDAYDAANAAIDATNAFAAAFATAFAADAAIDIATYAATASDYAAFATKNNETLRQPLLLAMREDLVALQTNQTLAGLELWPKESASLFDVNEWFGTFRKKVAVLSRLYVNTRRIYLKIFSKAPKALLKQSARKINRWLPRANRSLKPPKVRPARPHLWTMILRQKLNPVRRHRKRYKRQQIYQNPLNLRTVKPYSRRLRKV